jgi:hypothetical protein
MSQRESITTTSGCDALKSLVLCEMEGDIPKITAIFIFMHDRVVESISSITRPTTKLITYICCEIMLPPSFLTSIK